MALYENIFIARQEISPMQVDVIADNLAELITENGGSVKKREYWGLKTLAYKIKKNKKGHYVLFNFEAKADVIKTLEEKMRFNEDILRYLSVRIDEVDENPSPMMAKVANDGYRSDSRKSDSARSEKSES